MVKRILIDTTYIAIQIKRARSALINAKTPKININRTDYTESFFYFFIIVLFFRGLFASRRFATGIKTSPSIIF